MTISPTNQAKNSATLTNQSKQAGTATVPGNPIGLLLALTYSFFSGTIPANQAKNSVTLANQTKS